MDNRPGILWGIATASAVASFLILALAAGYAWFAALILALLILLLVALVLWILWNEDDESEAVERLSPFRAAPVPPGGPGPSAGQEPAGTGAAGAAQMRQSEDGKMATNDKPATRAAKDAPEADKPAAEVPEATDPTPLPEDEPQVAPDLPSVDTYMAREGVSEEDYDEFAGEEEAEEAHDDSGEDLANRADEAADHVPEAPDHTTRTTIPRIPVSTRATAGHSANVSSRGDPRTLPRKAPPAGSERPAPAAAPRAGDDLKRIRGVGPRIEAMLHDLGITTLAEIAAWSAADVARIEQRLAFPGRITREDWVAQARALLEGDA